MHIVPHNIELILILILFPSLLKMKYQIQVALEDGMHALEQNKIWN